MTRHLMVLIAAVRAELDAAFQHADLDGAQRHSRPAVLRPDAGGGLGLAWHRDAHQYTSDSIRTWMSRDGLSNTMLEAGFVDARYIR
jgi:hypothetical protein